MPELPEVETVRRGLEPAMLGARIAKVELRRADLRFPFPPHFVLRLTGRRVTGLGRRAKYLLVDLDDGTVLVMHMGMSGRFSVIDPADVRGRLGAFHHDLSEPGGHDHVTFFLSNGFRVIYNDTRRFGFMDLVRRSELADYPHFKGLGIEPTSDALSGEAIARLFDGKAAPLKAALLDQSLVAGLGNIYVCEALHRAGLSPKAPAKSIVGKNGTTTRKADLLAEMIRAVIKEAIEAGGSSLRDYAKTNGELGYFQHSFRVYDRAGKPCLKRRCTGKIKRITQAGRSTFYCPVCQK